MGRVICTNCGARGKGAYCAKCGNSLRDAYSKKLSINQVDDKIEGCVPKAENEKSSNRIAVIASLVFLIIQLFLWRFALAFDAAFFIISSIGSIVFLLIASAIDSNYKEKYILSEGINWNFSIAQGVALIVPYIFVSDFELETFPLKFIVIIPFAISYIIMLIGFICKNKDFPSEATNKDKVSIIIAQGLSALAVGAFFGIVFLVVFQLFWAKGREK